MAEILLFHHALGLTYGVRAFADDLRAAGHTVHTPDLYEGKTFTNLDDGVGYARQTGFQTIVDRGLSAAKDLPNELVYAGFSLGVMAAQQLAQTRPGAKGALLFDGCLPVSEFGERWPDGVPVQIHMMEDDPSAAEGDLQAAKELTWSTKGAELFLYAGDQHLFADSSTPGYDEKAAALLKERVLRFLNG